MNSNSSNCQHFSNESAENKHMHCIHLVSHNIRDDVIKYQYCIHNNQQIEDKIIYNVRIFCCIQENIKKEYVYISKNKKECKIKKYIKYILEDAEIKKYSFY